jgi:hypothetical protein
MMISENQHEMTAAIEDLQMEYRLLEDGKLLVMFARAQGVDGLSSINARKNTIRNKIAAMEFALRIAGGPVPAL